MIPPKTKNIIIQTVQKYAPLLQKFKHSNPVIMLGELKLDRIDQKIKKQAEKLNDRQLHKNTKSEGAKPKKYQKRQPAITYKSYTVDFKRKLIQKIHQLHQTSNSGLSKIIRSKAKELNIHPKNIFRWFHTKEIKKKEGGRKALYPEMEERLAQFIISNPKMKRKHILRQAKQIMEDLQIPGREYFNFSKGWYERFRERLVRRKIISGKIEAKREYDENSDSDFDESECEVKKEEFEVKMEYENENEVESSEEEGMMEMKEMVTKIDCDDMVLTYSSGIFDSDDERRDEKKVEKEEEKKEKMNKEGEKKEESELEDEKTDESEGEAISRTISISMEVQAEEKRG